MSALAFALPLESQRTRNLKLDQLIGALNAAERLNATDAVTYVADRPACVSSEVIQVMAAEVTFLGGRESPCSTSSKQQTRGNRLVSHTE
jgi:hypothetical protein